MTPALTCQHLHLTKELIGSIVKYKCDACPQLFTAAQTVITVKTQK